MVAEQRESGDSETTARRERSAKRVRARTSYITARSTARASVGGRC